MVMENQFKEISIGEFSYLLKQDEIAIKDVSESNTKVYARKYHYCQFGKIEIIDRLLPIEFIIKQEGKQKIVTIKKICA